MNGIVPIEYREDDWGGLWMSIMINQLQSVLELTTLLNSSKDVEYILERLMHVTLKLLKRADIGVIFLYEKDNDILRLKTQIGFGDIEITLKPGESITGMAFNQKKTLHLKNNSEMAELMSTMHMSNYNLLEGKIDKPMNDLQSSISCPLMHDDNCIGVFVIDNYHGKEPLNEDDVYLAELISQHATIAIMNASNYKRIVENNASIERYSEMVEEEKNRYEYSTFLHNKFTEMVLNGSSIDGIIAEVSKMLNRDVFTVDILNKISHFTVEVSVTREELKKGRVKFRKHLSQIRQTVFYCEEIKHWVFFNPIRVNKEVLGWVGIVSSNSEFNELELIAIDKCSTIIALEMLKNNELMMLEQSLKGDFLENLLADRSMEFMSKFTERYHYDFNHQHQLIIMRIDFAKIDTVYGKYLRYLYSEVRRIYNENLRNSITLQKRNYFITIFDRNIEIDREKIDQLIKRIFKKTRQVLSNYETEFECKIGISEVIHSQSDFRTVYDHTMQIFNLELNRKGNCNCYYYEDLEIKRFLLNTEKEELHRFVNKVMGNLISYQNSSRIDLFQTLQIYIKTGGNWTITKEVLHIHGNTLSYRLNRLREIMSYDFDNYQNRLRIQIALEIIELYPELEIK
jgi:sugar diacid utilization regulator/putative methionine-R-sulfoxide reductase with GAF domain